MIWAGSGRWADLSRTYPEIVPALELRRLWYLDGRKMALWSEPSRRLLRRDTQAISKILTPHIPRSCTHVRGHGGCEGRATSAPKADAYGPVRRSP